jgi:hypothetical protein
MGTKFEGNLRLKFFKIFSLGILVLFFETGIAYSMRVKFQAIPRSLIFGQYYEVKIFLEYSSRFYGGHFGGFSIARDLEGTSLEDYIRLGQRFMQIYFWPRGVHPVLSLTFYHGTSITLHLHFTSWNLTCT